MIFTALATLFAVKTVGGGIVGLLIKGIASVLASTLVFFIYSFKRDEFSVILSYINKIWTMIISRKNK